MASTALPEELLHEIINYAAATDHSSLLSLSLSSKQLRRLTVAPLFESVVVTGRKLSTLDETAWPSAWIKKLTLCDLIAPGPGSNRLQGRVKVFDGLLRQCLELREIKLGEDERSSRRRDMDRLLGSALASLPSLPLLETISNESAHDFRCLNTSDVSFATVKNLFITSDHLWLSSSALHSDWFDITFPRLLDLTFTVYHPYAKLFDFLAVLPPLRSVHIPFVECTSLLWSLPLSEPLAVDYTMTVEGKNMRDFRADLDPHMEKNEHFSLDITLSILQDVTVDHHGPFVDRFPDFGHTCNYAIVFIQQTKATRVKCLIALTSTDVDRISDGKETLAALQATLETMQGGVAEEDDEIRAKLNVVWEKVRRIEKDIQGLEEAMREQLATVGKAFIEHLPSDEDRKLEWRGRMRGVENTEEGQIFYEPKKTS